MVLHFPSEQVQIKALTPSSPFKCAFYSSHHPFHSYFPSTDSIAIPIHCTLNQDDLLLFSLLNQILPHFQSICCSYIKYINQCFIQLNSPDKHISSTYLILSVFIVPFQISPFLKLTFITTAGNNGLFSLTIS